MSTINISLPEKLRNQAQDLIDRGFYVSVSDLVRDSVRRVVNDSKYNMWFDEAKKEEKKGKTKSLKSKKQVKEFFKAL